MSRTRALLLLSVITAIGGALRFYNLAWGAPYYHFHMDEHYVFMGANYLRESLREAALSGKFFMYGPLPMYVLNVVRWEAEQASWDAYRDQASREAPLELRGVVDIPGDPLLAWVHVLSFTDRDAGAVHFVAKAEIKRPPP